MKFLVVIATALALAGSVPIKPGYGIPASPPVEIINVPELPRFLAPEALVQAAGVRVASPLPIPAPVTPVLPQATSPVAPVAPALIPRLAPAVPIVAPSSQFHAQDELGGFSFGYSNVNSQKNEVRTPDGVTRGFYEYVDANNVVQRVEYVSDDVNGFRVIATNLPIAPTSDAAVAAPVSIADTPEVAAAKAEFKKAFDEAVAQNEEKNSEEEEETSDKVSRRKRSVLTNGYGVPVANPIAVVPVPEPVPVAIPNAVRTISVQNPVPVAVPAVVVPQAVNTQYNAQDELGGVSFGYQNDNSARQEVRSPDGVTRGAYSYVDANGITQTVSYIADDLGFRVVGTNLPVAPIA